VGCVCCAARVLAGVVGVGVDGRGGAVAGGGDGNAVGVVGVGVGGCVRCTVCVRAGVVDGVDGCPGKGRSEIRGCCTLIIPRGMRADTGRQGRLRWSRNDMSLFGGGSRRRGDGRLPRGCRQGIRL